MLRTAARRFRDAPVNRKLMVLMMVTTASALVLSGVGIIVSDSVLFRGYLERDLMTLARIIADNSTASLAFEDPRSGGETLAALRARTHIVAACLYRADGSTLASYVRPGETTGCPAVREEPGTRATFRTITVYRPIRLGERRLGTLVMLYDLGEIGERIWLYGLTVIAVLLAASAVVFVLSSKLRDIFATPILDLARTATVVSQSKDYSTRAARLSNDEIGDLVTAFNEMLAGIERRDGDLRQSLAEREEALQRLALLNRELRKTNEDLARSNDDLERFAFVASHDLREPLRMVTLYSQLLVRQYGAADGDSKMYVDYIVGGATRMHELLSDLLAYLEISSSIAEDSANLDLNAVLEKVKKNLEMTIAETGAIITADPLPHIRAHEAHFVSLFQNLISNSMKYRSAAPPRIHVSVSENGGSWRFTIADNGMGIDPQYHARIFVAFKRLHGKDIPGTGIGLAICQRVVERYGGGIWVESELGQGARFIFTVPSSGVAVEMGRKAEGRRL